MIKPTLKYSILCGLFLVGLFFISINFGSNPLVDPRHFIFDLGVCSLFVFFACKEYKRFKNDGYLHFWQGISIGFVVVIPAVLLFSLVFYVVFEMNTVLIDGYKKGAEIFLISRKEIFLNKFSQEQFEEQLVAINDVTTTQLLISTFWKKVGAGFLIIPIVSIILRKRPK